LLGLTVTVISARFLLVIIVCARTLVAVPLPLLWLLGTLLLRLSWLLTLLLTLLLRLWLTLLRLVMLRLCLTLLRLVMLGLCLTLLRLLWLVWSAALRLWLLRLTLTLWLLLFWLTLVRRLWLFLRPRSPGLLLLLRPPGPVRLFLLPGAFRLPLSRRTFDSACLTGVSSIYGLLVKDLVYQILFLKELCPLNFELLSYFP